MPFDLSAYEPVEDRLRAFWSEHPNGRIITRLIHYDDGTYVVAAEVYRDQYLSDATWNEYPSATGLAQEAVTDRGVNSTSALENCETSAIGRALANLGYAAKGKRPSREEMSKASGEGPPGRRTGDGHVLDEPSPGTTSGEGGEQSGKGAAPTTSSGSSTEAPSHGTSSADSGTGGGGGADAGTADSSPPARTYPVDAAVCKHRRNNGRPARDAETDACALCGTPWVTAMEGTNADLEPIPGGSA